MDIPKKKTGQNRNVVNRKLSWFLCEMMVPTGAPKTAKWPGVKNWALCFVKNYKFSRISRYIKDIYGYLTTMIQISSIWKKSCNVSLWGYLSFAYLWLATFNMKCIVRLLEAPMDSWNFMETPEVSQNGATPSHYMSLVSILSHGHSITWSGGTPSAWGDRDMRSCRGQNLKKTS